MKEELIRDMENMEEIMEKLGGQKEDIWQDRFVYWIAKGVYDIIKYLILKGV